MTIRARLFVYDVGHGDHLLLRVEDGAREFHAVIDCHWLDPDPDRPPPALRQLEAWGVKRLDLLVLTHPHADHYRGLASIAEHFSTDGRTLGYFADPGLDLLLVAEATCTPGSDAHDELVRLHNATHGQKGKGIRSGPAHVIWAPPENRSWGGARSSRSPRPGGTGRRSTRRSRMVVTFTPIESQACSSCGLTASGFSWGATSKRTVGTSPSRSAIVRGSICEWTW